MQFSFLLSTTILASIASAVPITLTVQSSNEEINNVGITAVHEGAGINYMQLGTDSTSEQLEFDEENGIIYKEIIVEGSASYKLVLSSVPDTESYTGYPYLQLSVGNPNIKWYRDLDNVLIADNSADTRFYAAKNTNDFYNYSQEHFLAGVGSASIFGDKVTNLNEISFLVNDV